MFFRLMMILFKRLVFLGLAVALAVWLLWPTIQLYRALPPLTGYVDPAERMFQQLSDADRQRVVALEQQRRLEAQQQQDPRCQGKRFCKDMTTCEEARFYLATCGWKRLDHDGDGVPCEALCR